MNTEPEAGLPASWAAQAGRDRAAVMTGLATFAGAGPICAGPP